MATFVLGGLVYVLIAALLLALGMRVGGRRGLVALMLGLINGTGFTMTAGSRDPLRPDGWIVLIPAVVVESVLFYVLMSFLAPPQRRNRTGRPALAVPHPFRHRLARLRRYAQLTRITIRLGIVLYRSRRRARRDGAGAQERWVELRSALQEAGGTFVKLGQVLSTRLDLLPPAAIAELSRLQDDVAPAPYEEIRGVLAAELGAPVDSVFARFESQPLAAASIAQVYRARLTSGEDIVVKIQRPNIRVLVERDLDILLRLTRSLERHTTWGREIGILDLAVGFAESLREELDFRVEARNIAAVATALGSHASVRVPAVYEEWSTSRVLVLVWLDGVRIREAGPLFDELTLDRVQLARTLLRSYLDQILVHGAFHADPHPGNIFVLRNGQFALLDFGKVIRLDTLEQTALRDMLFALQRRDPAALSDALLDVAVLHAPLDVEQLDRALGRLMAQRLGPGAPLTVALITDLFQVLLRFGVAFSPGLAGVFQTLVTLDGTLRLLAPDFNMVDDARAYATNLLHASMTPAAIRRTSSDAVAALVPLLQQLPRRIDRITSAVERRTFLVNVRVSADERDARLVTRLGIWMVLVFLAGAVGLIGVMLLRTPGGPPLSADISVLHAGGYTGLIVALGLMLRVLIAVAREGTG